MSAFDPSGQLSAKRPNAEEGKVADLLKNPSTVRTLSRARMRRLGLPWASPKAKCFVEVIDPPLRSGVFWKEALRFGRRHATLNT